MYNPARRPNGSRSFENRESDTETQEPMALNRVPPFRIESVIREHVSNAMHFLEDLAPAAFRAESCEFFERLCSRCESNIDAIRIAGEEGIATAQAGLAEDAQAARVVTILLAESDANQPAAAEQATGLLQHRSTELRHAAWAGLRLANAQFVEPYLRQTIVDLTDFPSAAALDILAFHRLPVTVDLPQSPGDDSDVAWLQAEAGGRIPGVWNADHLRCFLVHRSPRVREAALRASARCGLRELVDFCREAASSMIPDALEACEFLGVVGSLEDSRLLQDATSKPLTAKAALSGLGRLGLPTNVSFILEFLDETDLAETAGAALERITGQEMPRSARETSSSNLTEDELDFEEPQPAIDAGRVRAWWAANASCFDPTKRWQRGLCVSENPLGPVFDRLPLQIRYDVYLRQRALEAGTPDWELEAWYWKQKNPRN